ncbi:MAG: ABC transporter ATP-binding protein, partial [Bacteroidota bacterium]
PDQVASALDERLWEAEIKREELAHYQEDYQVISSRFHLGKLQITVVADDMPTGDFWRKAPSLEDAYFHLVTAQDSPQAKVGA